MSDRTNKREIQLELNDKTLKKAADALIAMKEEFSKRVVKRPAEELIRQNIEQIDELSKIGASLPQIYERLNKSVSLGISANSFAVYVRRIRKEVGSDQYNQRTQKQIVRDNKKDFTTSSSETVNAQSTKNEAVKEANRLHCKECVNAKKIDLGGIEVYHCDVCGSDYAVNKDGTMLKERLNS